MFEDEVVGTERHQAAAQRSRNQAGGSEGASRSEEQQTVDAAEKQLELVCTFALLEVVDDEQRRHPPQVSLQQTPVEVGRSTESGRDGRSQVPAPL